MPGSCRFGRGGRRRRRLHRADVRTTIATRWFEKRRGVVLGIFAGGNATGALIFLPAFGQIIDHVGWRPCAYILSGVALCIIPLILLVVRERPSDLDLPAYGATEVDATVPARVNPIKRAFNTLSEASRSRTFWVLAGTFFICGASTNGLIGAHLVPACGDHGIPESRAAGLLAAMGVFDLVGTTLSGWLSDRYSSRWLLFWYYGLRGVSLLFLPAAFGLGIGWVADLRRLLRAGLDRDRAADGEIGRRRVRKGSRAAVLRLDRGRASARRGDHRVRCGCGAQPNRQLRRCVHHLRTPVSGRGRPHPHHFSQRRGTGSGQGVIEFWFEFASTYSYVAAMQIEAKCRNAGVARAWRPFSLGPIFALQGWGDSHFNLNPRRGAYMWRDLERLTEKFGLPWQRPVALPAADDAAPARRRRVRGRTVVRRLCPRRIRRELRGRSRDRRARRRCRDSRERRPVAGRSAAPRRITGTARTPARQHRARDRTRHHGCAELRGRRRTLLGRRNPRRRDRLGTARRLEAAGSEHETRCSERFDRRRIVGCGVRALVSATMYPARVFINTDSTCCAGTTFTL